MNEERKTKYQCCFPESKKKTENDNTKSCKFLILFIICKTAMWIKYQTLYQNFGQTEYHFSLWRIK